VVASLPGVMETKVRPAVIIASEAYLREHRDIMVGILTTKVPHPLTATDYLLDDWQAAGLRASSCFRMYVLTIPSSNATVIGHLSPCDRMQVRQRVRTAFAPL
jgi:mRNA interferase MazF